MLEFKDGGEDWRRGNLREGEKGMRVVGVLREERTVYVLSFFWQQR